MANVYSIHSVGDSLAGYLGKTYPTSLSDKHPCQFRVLSSHDLAKPDDNITGTTLSLYLHRITVNEHLRNTGPNNQATDLGAPLSLDLHYLVSMWANDFFTEHTVMAWTMRQLHQHQLLTQADLSPEGGWSPGDFVQVIPAELSQGELLRIWDVIKAPYRLSVAYLARAVRIDGDPVAEGRPVVATRFGYGGGASL